jgi:hypothetical protein
MVGGIFTMALFVSVISGQCRVIVLNRCSDFHQSQDG